MVAPDSEAVAAAQAEQSEVVVKEERKEDGEVKKEDGDSNKVTEEGQGDGGQKDETAKVTLEVGTPPK